MCDVINPSIYVFDMLAIMACIPGLICMVAAPRQHRNINEYMEYRSSYLNGDWLCIMETDNLARPEISL